MFNDNPFVTQIYDWSHKFLNMYKLKVNNLFVQSELSIIKEQLLNRFVPDDDVCPIGSSSANVPKKNAENRKSMEEVIMNFEYYKF